MIEIKVDNKVVNDVLSRLASATANPGPVLRAIGEDLVLSTKKRFETSTAPDGSRWKPNSQATYLGYLGNAKSNHRKDGRINSRGADKVMAKKPLIGKTGNLAQQISYAVDGNGLRIGSPMEYAAMQQFGGQKSKFPNLWGDIPARPFLGISDSDEQMIVSTVNNYLRGVIG
jgi:phage virion morphogenesis protein